jgi:replicative DNA helicase
VQSISALIRNMAVETGLPVIAGAQLNRQATNKPGNKNSVASILRPEFLREAGDLEQDANLILGIYNRTAGLLEQDGESITGTSDFVVVALKNREGPINGTPIELTYNRPLWRIDG